MAHVTLQAPLSREVAELTIRAVEAAMDAGASYPFDKTTGGRAAIKEAAPVLGITPPTLRNRLWRAWQLFQLAPRGIEPPSESAIATRQERAKARKGEMGFDPVLPGYEIAATTVSFDKRGEVVRRTVRQRPEAGQEFDLPQGRRVGKVTAQLGPDGRVEREWVRHSPEDNALAVVEACKATFESYRGWARLPPMPPVSDSDTLTVYPVADLHLRMLAWGKESGEDYDIPIAIDLIKRTFASVIHQSPRSQSAVFLGLGDLLHADNNENRTMQSGHTLDVDTRYQKGLNAAAFLVRAMIEMLLQHHETVTVRLLPGNHDEHSTSALALAMVAFFDGHSRVVVDNDPGQYWFARFGSNLLGAHHGHKSKPDRWAGIMASHRPQDWGETIHRHFFGGHLHHKQRGGEGSGMTWEIMQTPAAKDAYSAGAGYWSGRSMASRVFHREGGFLTGPQVNIIPTIQRAHRIGAA